MGIPQVTKGDPRVWLLMDMIQSEGAMAHTSTDSSILWFPSKSRYSTGKLGEAAVSDTNEHEEIDRGT